MDAFHTSLDDIRVGKRCYNLAVIHANESQNSLEIKAEIGIAVFNIYNSENSPFKLDEYHKTIEALKGQYKLQFAPNSFKLNIIKK